MSEYNVLNYTEQGGAVTHIGGKLVIEDGATVEGLEGGGYVLPTATANAIGGVKLVANQAESSASTVAALKDDLNTLLSALKAAGVMAADS